MITTMAIKARTMDIQLDGTLLKVSKIMASDPRRIGKIVVHLFFPPELLIDEKQKDILERTARTCPVERTLHPNVELDMQFNW